jgi:acyl-CoA reductase-like NAD-dependent aldehyde dehydrogenase
MTIPWTNRSPGDLRISLPPVTATPPEPSLAAAHAAARDWARTPFATRAACLRSAADALRAEAEPLAQLLALEIGKPLTEARGELAAVLAKFDLTIADAEAHLATRPVTDGPHPASIRHLARGPAAIIGPFNFPLHLPHGALLPHLAAGNPILFKPSPLGANVAAKYAALMAPHFPSGVFQLVQGGADESLALCTDARVRAIVFTGSVAAGRSIARAVAEDYSKQLALELGGKNATLVCSDADLDLAARAVADALCLSAGQRCNATSRLILHDSIAPAFLDHLLAALAQYVPGDPLDPATKLGPLTTATAHKRFADALCSSGGRWLLPGAALGQHGDAPGYYVRPAVRLWEDPAAGLASPLLAEELFAPLLEVFTARDEDEMIRLHDAVPFGLTASVFTGSQVRFDAFAAELQVGNLYANLPTTFSPSALPFGGLGLSGNGRPAGRHFIRFTSDEQAVQVSDGSLT